MKKILIVDDAQFMRMMIRKSIEIYGADLFEVVGEAGNGFEAVEQYKSLNPDIVTMDITMPDCNGIQAVELIKAIDASANILMVSAMGQQQMIVEAVKAGAKDFIVKPFKEDKLIESLLKFK